MTPEEAVKAAVLDDLPNEYQWIVTDADVQALADDLGEPS